MIANDKPSLRENGWGFEPTSSNFWFQAHKKNTGVLKC